MNDHVLTTERLLLRHWRASDAEPFARMNGDPRVMRFMPRLLARSESDGMIERIEQHFVDRGFGLFVLELRGTAEFLGYTGLAVPRFHAPFMPCVEIGWRIAAEFWKRGFATEAAREVVRFAFEELALDELVSFTVPANRASIRVMEKLGMTYDCGDDFDHPLLPEEHPLRRHVLYRLRRA